MRRLAIAAAMFFVAASVPLSAQHAPSIVISPAPAHPMHSRPFLPSPILLGSPWLANYAPMVQPPVTPTVIVVQAQPAAPEVKEETKPITPLMIELQDGKYVRSDARPANSAGTKRLSQAPASAQKPPRTLAPAVLIFRDGHREQVREYTMVDGAIYAHGDYWIDGYWNKKIPFTTLNLPATISANHESGVDFVLPSGPNVVVMRP